MVVEVVGYCYGWVFVYGVVVYDVGVVQVCVVDFQVQVVDDFVCFLQVFCVMCVVVYWLYFLGVGGELDFCYGMEGMVDIVLGVVGYLVVEYWGVVVVQVD